MTRRAPNAAYWTLRWGALLFGGGICGWVGLTQGASLAKADVLLLSLLAFALRQRTFVLRQSHDGAKISHVPGESAFVIVLLRDGPAAALAAYLLTELWTLPSQWPLYRTHFQGPRGRAVVTLASGLLFTPAMFWVGGVLYGVLGGAPILSPPDSAHFFQDPRTALLPLLAALLVAHGLGDCLFNAALARCTKHRGSARAFLDPMRSAFVGLEALSGALAVVLWTAWGWGTVPFSLLINETLMFAGRSRFERLSAKRDAEFDPLTGLASWRGIDNFLHHRIGLTTVRNASLALLFIDADGLKPVNDRFGHAAGDDLLKLIGDTCRLHTRERDLVGRRGGDEFLVVLDETDRAGAERMVERLQGAVADALAVHPLFSETCAGVSIGVGMYPQDAREIKGLIETADRQMYANKQARKSPPQAV